jgi:hypothetical protein
LVEADLQQYYGIPLSELGRSLSWRRLGVLIGQLPVDARTVRAQAPTLEWSAEMHMLALISDQLAAISWQLGGDKNAPRPKPIRRPGEAPETMGSAVPLSELRRRLHPEEFTDDS